ncbi:MAG: hypothetical protein ETSY2_51685 [Candidatus Entotheonella gemina]|uniref:Uncharacterized protein n=1 Tax=Candidatus Entotheonella gemina TaxID=1429439 RepID=W4L605_9BACT|nr:MAG: hypothetical protein ETSY2_51685 [Candidatus Entotheonella gemina]
MYNMIWHGNCCFYLVFNASYDFLQNDRCMSGFLTRPSSAIAESGFTRIKNIANIHNKPCDELESREPVGWVAA